MTSTIRPMGPVEWALLALLSTFWGSSFFFAELGLRSFDPLALVLARVGLAALLLHLFARIAGLPFPRDRRLWAALFVMALLNNAVPFSLIFSGQTQIGSGLAAILNAATPLWTVLIAHVATRDEKLSWYKLAGIAVGFSGVVAIVGPSALAGLTGDVFGQLAVLGAGLSYALAGIFGRRFAGLHPLDIARGQTFAASAIMVPAVVLAGEPLPGGAPALAAWIGVLGLATFPTAFGYPIYFLLLARAGATNILLVTFLVPVTALVLGVGFLGESLAARHLVGMVLIGAGLALIDGRAPRALAAYRR